VWLTMLLFGALLLSKGETPLRLDEAWTVEDLLGRRSLHVGVQVRERVFEWILLQWLKLVGHSVPNTRLLMNLCGLAALALTVQAAKEGDAASGGRGRINPLAAALVFVGLPVILLFSVEINRYGLVILASAVSVWAALALRRRPDVRIYAAFAGAGLLAFYNHHTAAFTLLVPQTLLLAAQAWRCPPAEQRTRRIALVVVPLAQLLLLLPEVPLVLERAQLYASEQDTVYAEVYVPLGLEALRRLWTNMTPALAWPLRALYALALLGLLGAGLRARPSNEQAASDAEGAIAWDLRALAVGPWLGALIGSIFQPMLAARVILPCAPALALVAGRAFPRHPRRAAALVLTVPVLAWSAFLSWQGPEDMPTVIHTLASEARAGDGLVIHPPFVQVIYDGNLRLMRGGARPPLPLLPVNAPTPLGAAQVDFSSYPRRVFLVAYDSLGHSDALLAEMQHRFRNHTKLLHARGFELYRFEEPLSREAVLAAGRARGAAGLEPEGLTAYREGTVYLHQDQPGLALEAFLRAHAAIPTGEERSERVALDHRQRALSAIVWAAARAGDREQALRALDEADRLELQIPPAFRAAAEGVGE
jgi:hypothetical protein